MDASQLIRERQRAWARHCGIPLQKGNPRSQERPLYTHSLEENLYEPLCADAFAEYEQGDGTPLAAKNDSLPHLLALHNSDALTANVFHYWKVRDPGRACRYLGVPDLGIVSLHFEQKFRILPRGGTQPNVDMAIRYAPDSQCDWVGVESKLSETYPAKTRKLFDHKYFASGPWWDGLDAVRRLAESFRGDGSKNETVKRHLDRGQLVKHLLGMRNDCRKRGTDLGRVVLVYLWYDVATPEAQRHWEEIAEFAKTLEEDGIQFQSLTWQTLIRRLAEGEGGSHPEYTDYLKARYL